MKTFLTLVLISITSLSFAQGLVEEYDQSCNCTHYTNHYDNGDVSATYTTNASGQKNGTEKAFYVDGNLQYERVWSKGKLNGSGKHYFRNGQLYYTEYHENGIKKGDWTFNDEEGDIKQKIKYTGNGNDGTYEYYHAGIHYFSQIVVNDSLQSETVLNQEIYDQLKSEAEAAQAAGKQ
ncbi:hypothetical protein N8911_01810 [bacterium]|jgi:antitoxin component YwqK of YwqJK toxin-antitoxin module|nr:hypothetical protein [bacterium]